MNYLELNVTKVRQIRGARRLEEAIMRKVVGLSVVGLTCWLVMFLAGTDVWHYTGSPDFWRLTGPPYSDLRAFGYAFYLQFFILIGAIAVGIWSELKTRREN